MNKHCPECQGLMVRQKTTLIYEQDGVTLHIHNVPAWVCTECGKRLIPGPVAHQIDQLLNQLEEKDRLRQFREDVNLLRKDISQVRSASLELALAS